VLELCPVNVTEAEILLDGQIGNQGRILKDGGNAGLDRLCRGTKARRPSIHLEFAAIGKLQARQNLDEGTPISISRPSGEK